MMIPFHSIFMHCVPNGEKEQTLDYALTCNQNLTKQEPWNPLNGHFTATRRRLVMNRNSVQFFLFLSNLFFFFLLLVQFVKPNKNSFNQHYHFSFNFCTTSCLQCWWWCRGYMVMVHFKFISFRACCWTDTN